MFVKYSFRALNKTKCIRAFLTAKQICISQKKIFVLCHRDRVGFSLFICVCDRVRQREALQHFPWGGETEMSVSGSALTHPSLPQYTDTHTHTLRNEAT